jgi:hypothetical protein
VSGIDTAVEAMALCQDPRRKQEDESPATPRARKSSRMRHGFATVSSREGEY